MRGIALLAALLGLSLLVPAGCSQDIRPGNSIDGVPLVRVRLLQGVDQAAVTASQPPTVRGVNDRAGKVLNLPSAQAVPLTLSPAGWRIGNVAVGGPGELIMLPGADGSVAINGSAYHGRYRFVPVSATQFDVVNDVDIENYLKSVVSKELYASWHPEAYAAQAIAARTYALYEAKTGPAGRHWDLYPDQRSQVYGGISAETPKSRAAINATYGIVAAYGPMGQEKIFKAYFSSCCGGINQSAADAFHDAWSEPLSEHVTGSACAGSSPKFNWGPIVIAKEELGRRIRLWGARKERPEKNIGTIASVDIAALRLNRPISFAVTDSGGMRFVMACEDFRGAVNTDAQPNTVLPSSFCKPVNDGGSIRFTEGHGYGHGVGMCQYCVQAKAVSGMPHEDIVRQEFPGCRLVRAY